MNAAPNLYTGVYSQIADKRREWLGSTKVDSRLLRLIDKYAPDQRGLLVEIGCNQGQFLAKVLQECRPNLLGFDINQSAIHRPVDSCLNGKLKVRDIEKGLPLANSSVNVIVSSHTLEHIKNIEKVSREIERVLQPGGVSIHIIPWEIPGLRGLLGIGVAIRSLSKSERISPRVCLRRSRELHIRSFRKNLALFKDEISFKGLIKNTSLKIIREETGLCFLYAPTYCLVLKK